MVATKVFLGIVWKTTGSALGTILFDSPKYVNISEFSRSGLMLFAVLINVCNDDDNNIISRMS